MTDELERELAAALVDAERYRFLRENTGKDWMVSKLNKGVSGLIDFTSCKKLDAAIDAALTRDAKGKP